MTQLFFRLLLMVVSLGCLSISCLASASNISQNDPYETYNRHAFALNQKVDKVVYKPVATIYKTVTPNIAQKSITNFFNNLATIPVIINDALQLKGKDTALDSWRLVINSTFGILGLFDVASKVGIPDHQNDFGLTLNQYGYRHTHYLIIPFLGPSTTRDAIGYGVDYEAFSVYPYIESRPTRYSLIAVNLIQQRASLLQFQNLMDQAAVDPYEFQRNAYIQRRNYLIEKNLGQSQANEGTDPYVAE